MSKALTSEAMESAFAAFRPSVRGDPVQWLRDVGLEHFALSKSPHARFGICTSNNVESVNSSIRALRKLPVMEMLIGI